MLKQNSIKNMKKLEFYPFLRSLGYKNEATLVSGKTNNDYYNLEIFLKSELAKEKSLLTKKALNEFLYSKFFFEINHYHYVYNLLSLLDKDLKTDIELAEIEPFLKTKELKLNYNLVDVKCDDPYSLCSTRYLTKQKDNKEYIHRLQFLFFIEEVETTKGATNLFCCVDFNLGSKFVSFKFNSYALESYNNSISIVEKLISILQDKDGIFKRLKVVTGSYNQSTTRKAIQSLFINLSSQAEDLLEKKANPNIKKEVKKFLETIEIPDSDDYINQIISVVYQNISKEFKKTLFNDGWVFRFVFKEGDKTRASSSTEDFEPVYGKKVYWNLKELMFKNRGTDFIEAGFYWLTNQSKEPVAVKLEQKNNIVIMQYYKQEFNNEKRREKEDFVLRKFREGISKKS